ncbi:MAG: phosphoribosylformylglycinamidine synthase subunit PurQ [Patescibacteria group bacterium]|nr:phosphoribosylformylglycinamidine synthase subunit PurQ [Patescibacteria group bacterium]
MKAKTSKLKAGSSNTKAVRALVFSGYGLNCEEEAAFGLQLAGAKADIVHVNDLIDGKAKLKDYHILCFPGGFAYGDDTGSGKAYANRVKNHLSKELAAFLKEKKLIIGICNGFQVLTQMGLLPGNLVFNESNRYSDRWTDMRVEGDSPWLKGVTTISAPIGHGEGRYVAPKKLLAELKKKKQVALRYIKGETTNYQDLPANPNGAMENIAGVLSHEGRVFGMMPHPDRALFATNRPDWPLLKEASRRTGEPFPEEGPGVQIFRNGVEYFKNQ